MLHGLLAIVTIGMATASGAGPGVAGAAAADASSDIPGVPLPGPVAAGRLGGGIYDVVYQLSVEPGHVIVVGLSGTQGTDFDIYLFDSSATTVVSPTGLLTKSAGPTSIESISWPSRLGGTYYVDLNGATDVEGDFRLTVQTVPDPTPPTVSIALAGGKSTTNQLTVPLLLTATEDLSGVAEMALSPDGATFAAWQPFQATATWTLTPGDGTRAVWAKVRNGVGLESTIAVDTITIDTVPPSVIALDPAPGSTVIGLRPRFTATFNEPINATSWTDLGLIVQSATGSLVTGTYSYDPPTRMGAFVPASNLQPGALYVINIGPVRDLAGNDVAPLASWSITPLTPTSLLAVANPKVVALGGSSKIHVSFTGTPPPTSVDMQTSDGSGGFISTSTFALVNGELSLSIAPVRNTTYRFRYAGAFGIAPAQYDVRVLVRRSVVLLGRDSTVVARAKAGASVNLTAAISPAAAGVTVSFRVYRFDPSRRVWLYAGSKGRTTDATGRAQFTWVPPSSGSWYVRAAVVSTVDFANNTSPVYRWSVTR